MSLDVSAAGPFVAASAPASLEHLASDDLMNLARAGDSGAWGALYSRYCGYAWRVAERAGCADPADAVAEAFTKIMAATDAGHGPTQAFHAYLATTVRTVVIDQGRRRTRETPTDVADIELPALEHLASEPSVNAAYRSLPSRWKEAIWRVDVEGAPPRAAATAMGMATPNAMSALLKRARAGLRHAYANELAAESHDQTVRLYLAALAAGEAPADTLMAPSHIDGCPECGELHRRVLAVLHASESPSRSLVLVALAAVMSGASARWWRLLRWIRRSVLHGSHLATAGAATAGLAVTAATVMAVSGAFGGDPAPAALDVGPEVVDAPVVDAPVVVPEAPATPAGGADVDSRIVVAEPVVTMPVEAEVIAEPDAVASPIVAEPVRPAAPVVPVVPAAEDPVVEVPVIDDPVVESRPPVADDPVPTEPVAIDPVAVEPAVTEPEPSEPVLRADQPVVHADEPVVHADQLPVDDPLVDDPLVDDPLVDDPLVDDPLVDDAPDGGAKADRSPGIPPPIASGRVGNPLDDGNSVPDESANPLD